MQTMRWRWDQGRVSYFQFDNIKLLSTILSQVDGIALNERGIDPLREILEEATDLPFLPRDYRVWRNYARVFGCSLLASSIANHLRVTELCRKLSLSSQDVLSVDDYLAFLAPRFYFPFPVFDNYDTGTQPIYPFCVVLRFLIANIDASGNSELQLDALFSKLIGNACRGDESLSYYGELQTTTRRPIGDEKRQVREMLIFFSQFSFLKWADNTLFLDLEPPWEDAVAQLERIATPIRGRRLSDRNEELLALGSLSEDPGARIDIPERHTPSDIIFAEGKKVRLTHLRTERSRRLRQIYFSTLSHPCLCDMCFLNFHSVYPWVGNLLEVHHLLPLVSPIRTETSGTSLADLVPLCPNCHRSVHEYYRNWLHEREQNDFLSRQEARNTYTEAKHAIIR